jgi:nucleoside-diphosphate-sugar epimerase
MRCAREAGTLAERSHRDQRSQKSRLLRMKISMRIPIRTNSANDETNGVRHRSGSEKDAMEWKKRRCLVTGGTGFVGSHVVEALQASGHDVTIVSRHSSGMTSVTADISDRNFAVSSDYDWIFHVAGKAHINPKTETQRREFYRVNHEGTRNLLAALRRNTLPESFVLVSTVAVYGMQVGENVTESAPREARDPYGDSKIRAEDEVTQWGQQHAVRIGIVRLPLVAGRSPPGNLGRMFRAIARGRYVGIGDSSARRSMVLAEDVGRVMERVAHVGGVYHLTDGYHPSFAEIERTIASAISKSTPLHLPRLVASAAAHAGDFLEAISRRTMPFDSAILAKMTSSLTFADRSARAALGWSPRRVLDALPDLVRASQRQ